MFGILLIIMCFCHVIDDYYLQGILASLKQKKWWEKNAPDPLYQGDYITALLIHGFSWSFMIHLPILYELINTNNTSDFSICIFIIGLIINLLIHSFVDNLKANKLKINLTQDQIIHFIQIFITWFIWYLLIG